MNFKSLQLMDEVVEEALAAYQPKKQGAYHHNDLFG